MKSTRRKPSVKPRPNQIERHPERTAIEMARAAGVSIDRIAERFGISRDAVWRHWNALPAEYKASLIIDVPREELQKRAIEESGTLIDHVKLIRNVVEQQLLIAKTCNDSTAVATLTRAALEANGEVGKLTGEIARLLPGMTVNHTTINILERPEFMALESGLIDIAARHPDAKADIIQLVRRLKQSPAPAMIEGEAAVA